MQRTFARKQLWGASCLALALCFGALPSINAQTITFEGVRTNRANLTNLGDAGFWFAQFAAASPISGAAVNNNDRNSLPSWVTPDFNSVSPTYSFSSTASSKGGQPTWATLTLPDGDVGLSGALVDSNTANNSANTISRLHLAAGTPPKFRMYVVTDNTAGQHDPAGRLRARGERTGVFDISGPNTPPGLAANMNGAPDVYSWIYTGFAAGDFIKLQLNSGVAGEQASISGIMFDAVPEPSSAMLLMFGMVSCLLGARRVRG